MSLFVIIVVERFIIFKKLPKILGKIIGKINVLILIPLTWVAFAISDLDMLLVYFTRLFPFFGQGIAVNENDFSKNIGVYWMILLPSLILLIPNIYEGWVNSRRKVIYTIIWIVMFWACIYSLSGAAGNPFMYFRF